MDTIKIKNTRIAIDKIVTYACGVEFGEDYYLIITTVDGNKFTFSIKNKATANKILDFLDKTVSNKFIDLVEEIGGEGI